MPALRVVIEHLLCDHAAQLRQVGCLEQQRMVLGLEAPDEGFHLRVVLRTVERIGEPSLVLEQQLRGPAIARVARPT